MKKLIILAILIALAAAGGGWWYYSASSAPAVTYQTAPVERGSVTATISATGTIEPVEVVDVGAQVAGMIQSFGKDPADSNKLIDFGSHVEEGTILVRIDDSLYRADAEQARADLGQAEANVQKAEADLVSLRSKLYQTQRDWERARQLSPPVAIAQVDYDTAQNAYETAKAAVPGGEAAVAQAKKAVEKAKAALLRAETNLGYCVIKSPVKGVIVDRRVNIGQTVVSSLNAPSLFLIAKDLTRLQVWASVNEADIGQIKAGQKVTFTVDAYPGQVFPADVDQVRLNANMTQNVVTYTVVVNVNNKDNKLLPYMTANLQFLVEHHDDVLRVPVTALRWQPSPALIAPDAREEVAKARTRHARDNKGPAATESQQHGTLWLPDGGYVRPVRVEVGLTDGVMTEVRGKDLKEGTQVVLRAVQSESDNSGADPFTPKMFNQKKPGQ